MKIRGSVVSVLVLCAVALIGCQRQESRESLPSAAYEVRAAAGDVSSSAAAKMIDTVAVLEGYPDDEISEFIQGPWAVAVKNLRTGYTYYYDSKNNFLGRRK